MIGFRQSKMAKYTCLDLNLWPQLIIHLVNFEKKALGLVRNTGKVWLSLIIFQVYYLEIIKLIIKKTIYLRNIYRLRLTSSWNGITLSPRRRTWWPSRCSHSFSHWYFFLCGTPEKIWQRIGCKLTIDQ